MSTTGAAFSTRENGIVYDYFQISLKGVFTPNENLIKRKICGMHTPILASSYTMDAYPIHLGKGEWRPIEDIIGLSKLNHHNSRIPLDINEVFKLVILDNEYEPKSPDGSSTVTHAADLGLSGSIGWPGSANGGMNLKISRSVARVIPDVGIRPFIGPQSHAKWVFYMNNLKTKLERNNPKTNSTFSPEVKWIWKIPHEQAINCNLYTIKEDNVLKECAGARLNKSNFPEYYFSFGVKLDVGTRRTYKILKTFKSGERLYDNVINAAYTVRVPEIPKEGETKVWEFEPYAENFIH